MLLSFREFEDQCKQLIMNLGVEIDWWRERVSELAMTEAKGNGQDVEYWEECKEKAKEDKTE